MVEHEKRILRMVYFVTAPTANALAPHIVHDMSFLKSGCILCT